MSLEPILKKLHVTIPSELFNIIYKEKDMENIDNIVANLLYSYYGIDSNGIDRKISR